MTRKTRSIIIEAVILTLATLAVAAWGMVARGQEIVPEPIPTTEWQTETQAEIDRLALMSVVPIFGRNKTFTVVVDEGEYDLYSLNVWGHVSLIANPNVVRSVRLRYIGQGDATVLTVGKGYGCTISGFEIVARGAPDRVTGIKTEGTINGRIRETRVDLRGYDCIGLDIAGRESLAVRDVDLRGTVPVRYRWGDNVSIHNADLGATGRADAIPNTCVWIAGMPNQVTFDGAQSWQGGEHAVYGVVESKLTGQGLNIYNLRYEQSLSTRDRDTAAIHLHFTDRQLESLLILGSRWTDRLKGWDLRGVWPVTRLGGYLPGE